MSITHYLYKIRSLTLFPNLLLRYQNDDKNLQKILYIGKCLLTFIIVSIIFDIFIILHDYAIYIFIYSIILSIYITKLHIKDIYRMLVTILICFILFDIFLTIIDYIYIIKIVINILILFFSIKEYCIMNE